MYRYKNSDEALERLHDDFNDWTSILTSYSVQLAYAIIAANWAVYGTAQKLINNLWARWSIIIVFLFLVANLIITRWIGLRLKNRYDYAESDPENWKKEYEEKKDNPGAWPYTKKTEVLGTTLREIKVWSLVISAILFIVSLFA